MKNQWVTIFGFGLFIFGFIALILSLVGLQLTFLTWLDGNKALGLLLKLLMIMFGGILIYVSKVEE